jgi:hypothetical protein
LSHKPGHAQVDFGEADGIIDGKLVRFHYFCMDLPHSDAPFIKAYPAEVAEAFCEGHVAAFAFFGGVPQSILYDNTSLRWRRSWATGRASAAGCSPRCKAITCLRTSLAARERAMTKARLRAGRLLPAPFHGAKAGGAQL